jgi:hypothetical protein
MPGKESKLVAFTLYPGVTPLDLVRPLTVLRDLKVGSPYRTVVVGGRREPMDTDTPLRMLPAKAFGEVPHPFATSAGGSVGIDLMLHLVARLTSASRAMLAQLIVEYDPRPPFGGIDWSGADTDRAGMLAAARGS